MIELFAEKCNMLKGHQPLNLFLKKCRYYDGLMICYDVLCKFCFFEEWLSSPKVVNPGTKSLC